MKISIVGTGYVGLVTGACFSKLGNEVLCLDTSRAKVNSLKKCKVPFYEPGLEQIIKNSYQKNKIDFTTSLKTSIQFADIFFVCVGTPQKYNGKPNLDFLFTYLNDFIKTILECKSFLKNKANKKYLYIKSTIPPGTIRKVHSLIERHNLSSKIIIASNPEFLKEGNAVKDFMNPDRVVLGTINSEAELIAKNLYKSVVSDEKFLTVSPESAEIIKYSSNAFLATKISFINQVSRLSDSLGADINDIREGIGMDKRIGNHFLFSGLGYGGSCFPKDIKGLEQTLKDYNQDSDLLTATINVNNTQALYFLQKIYNFYSESLKNKKIAVLGLSFKPNTDDIRDSVGIKIVKELSSKVDSIFAFEPIAKKNSKSALKKFKNVYFKNTLDDAISNSDCLIIATEYPEFSRLSPKQLKPLSDKCIFDGRNILKKEEFVNAGFTYYGIGR